MLAVGRPDPVATRVPTPYPSIGASASAVITNSSRSLVATIRVFDAPSSCSLAPERLSTLAEEDLLRARLVIAPSVRLLSVSYPVADLRRPGSGPVSGAGGIVFARTPLHGR